MSKMNTGYKQIFFDLEKNQKLGHRGAGLSNYVQLLGSDYRISIFATRNMFGLGGEKTGGAQSKQPVD